MLGRSHFVSGVVAFEATAGALHYTPTQAIVGAIVVSSAALLPDIDHGEATISRTYGPVTRLISYLVATISGGHRKGTHCLFGIGLLGALVYFCLPYRHQAVGLAVLSTILIITLAAGVRIFKIPGRLDDFAPIPVVLLVVGMTNIDLSSVPEALVIGCLTHVAGDCATNSGCPIFFPFSNWRLKAALFSTGGWFELKVVFPALVLSAAGLAAWRVWGMFV